MTTFFKNKYSSETKKVLLIVLVLNLFVLIVKIFAGVMTKSLGIIGDAVHSAVDSINNIVGLVIVKYAVQPPDKDHPYGHEKFETLGAFAIVAFLAVASVEILHGSVDRLLHPVQLPIFKMEALWLLAFTLLINVIVWVYERNAGKKLNSDLLIADSSHTGSDVLITISVLFSQFFIAKQIYWIDAFFGIIIVFFIAKAAYEIIINTVPILVDQVWLDSKLVIDSVLSVRDVTDCYDVYSRRGPYSAFIECKIKVIPKDLFGAHKIADSVEEKLKEKFGDCKVMVHVEP